MLRLYVRFALVLVAILMLAIVAAGALGRWIPTEVLTATFARPPVHNDYWLVDLNRFTRVVRPLPLDGALTVSSWEALEGDLIVYQEPGDGTLHLYRLDVHRGRLTLLAKQQARVRNEMTVTRLYPSPDGRYLLAMPEFSAAVFLTDLHTLQTRSLTGIDSGSLLLNHDETASPWSPDSRWVVLMTPGGLEMVSAADDTRRVIPMQEGFYPVNAVWSDTGSLLISGLSDDFRADLGDERYFVFDAQRGERMSELLPGVAKAACGDMRIIERYAPGSTTLGGLVPVLWTPEGETVLTAIEGVGADQITAAVRWLPDCGALVMTTLEYSANSTAVVSMLYLIRTREPTLLYRYRAAQVQDLTLLVGRDGVLTLNDGTGAAHTLHSGAPHVRLLAQRPSMRLATAITWTEDRRRVIYARYGRSDYYGEILDTASGLTMALGRNFSAQPLYVWRP